ncbi:hypothetical protein [Burkholderia glumae]|uniref:UDP-glucose 4-epimerase n=1 Tax=Burkholderia glumae TaxID=337 RepID=A0AAP9XZQ2_BURGL|nr:hypothetical protein [Burkholderia glumae]ACR32362.1 UDP-glucose 4-epimerase [Burkholderia glumae BGR1]AJY63744.1 putative uDP-glucose 4-epimerase [Burkholderia glumae LMG 2196 = ATCC 33617]KHJ59335.1 UDP-glucose 4-epimerase [Burkholderia glumae]MCM2484442.1 hypothetical protein [Burkholderia glumae]MCM2494811.1 hypothetical protein [Burkholderia glumae]
MALSGELHDADWSVAIETVAEEAGGYRCRIQLMLRLPEGPCEHAFTHSRCHPREADAAVEGLRVGMTWIEMRKANAFTI